MPNDLFGALKGYSNASPWRTAIGRGLEVKGLTVPSLWNTIQQKEKRWGIYSRRRGKVTAGVGMIRKISLCMLGCECEPHLEHETMPKLRAAEKFGIRKGEKPYKATHELLLQ